MVASAKNYSRARSGVLALMMSASLVPAARADILIAVAGPVTGPLAAPGSEIFNGAKQAAEDINAKGGINGEKIILSIQDDACDPKQAVSVANAIVAAGIKLVDGHFCSGSTMPASDIYNESGITAMTVSSNPKITERGYQNIFRFGGRDDQQGPAGAEFILKKFAGKKVALLNDKSTYGVGLVDGARAAFKAANAVIAIDDGINPGEKDYSTVVLKLKEADVEAVYFGGYHTEAGLMARQALDSGYKLSIVGGDGLNTSELGAIAGAAAENVFFTFPPDATKTAAGKEIATRMRAKNLSASGWTIYSYAIIEALAEGVARAGGQDAAKVSEALRSKPVTTVLGDVSFDAKGDNTKPGYVVYHFVSGTPTEIE
ncbi:ABC transporter substrate-binding protein [Mesorhizobium sp. ES1-1]|uniref:ABC transporter substrate-binding protein n=1 Tax=Mesorhizobium sp. ES1-1 TaxID=2876629 RepID=UPI001CCDE545|nr:ABC transporter substrate-binding protein [Mesorhizobium sp. ES1-1]MBZ9678249.1 ABC transporter substrate-binding protein [Mesorhizobium sp. ES1-1]